MKRPSLLRTVIVSRLLVSVILVVLVLAHQHEMVSAQQQRRQQGQRVTRIRGGGQVREQRKKQHRQQQEYRYAYQNSTLVSIVKSNDTVDSSKNVLTMPSMHPGSHKDESFKIHSNATDEDYHYDETAAGTAAAMERELGTVVYDAIVIGAGWAGLGAARTLQAAGITNFLVLEASNYVGGRCRTTPINSNNPSNTIELGCQWIHGASTSNPVFNLARSSGIPTVKSAGNTGVWSNVFGGSRPHRVSNKAIKKLQQTQYRYGFFPYQGRLQDSTNRDQPLRQTANRYINNKNLKGDTRLGFEYILDTRIVQEYAASLEDLSLWWWDSDSVISGPDHIIQQGAGKGYSGVLNFYAKPISSKIQLNSVVSNINWSNNIAVVTYRAGNGNTYKIQAKNVIVTVSLGVLKKGLIQFAPSLPKWKTNSIKKLGMGMYEKVILQWKDGEALPWPSNIEWVDKIAPFGKQGRWTSFFNMKATTGKNMIVAFAAGQEAVRVSGLSDATIKSEVMASLRSMFGNAAVPNPVNMVVTTWKSNNRSYGSYSYYKVGSKPKHRKWLGETLGGRLYFAGEACHLKYPSTTHGALLSGQTAGRNVVKKLGGRRKLLKK